MAKQSRVEKLVDEVLLKAKRLAEAPEPKHILSPRSDELNKILREVKSFILSLTRNFSVQELFKKIYNLPIVAAFKQKYPNSGLELYINSLRWDMLDSGELEWVNPSNHDAILRVVGRKSDYIDRKFQDPNPAYRPPTIKISTKEKRQGELIKQSAIKHLDKINAKLTNPNTYLASISKEEILRGIPYEYIPDPNDFEEGEAYPPSSITLSLDSGTFLALLNKEQLNQLKKYNDELDYSLDLGSIPVGGGLYLNISSS